jgi:uncharacterized protein (TIGR03084 family)
MDVADVRADLIAEQQALDDIVAEFSTEDWTASTPSPRWTVADQIGHLTYFDATATLAITDPERFKAHLNEMFAAMANEDPEASDPEANEAMTLADSRAMAPPELLAAWRSGRERLASAAEGLANDDRVPWYGPSMGSKSFLTARLMEAWAHGQDIVDAVDAERDATDRLRHVSQLGFITRGWTYANRGREAPAVPVRVELAAPSGQQWTFGPDEADESIVGSALDFCLVTTQRRHVDDTELAVAGDAARDWMEFAQLFAGPPTNGPRPHGEQSGPRA